MANGKFSFKLAFLHQSGRFVLLFKIFMKKIVVKIGTNALTNDDGSLNMDVMTSLVAQLAELRKGNDVLLVTSGAMGAGRSILKKELPYDETTKRQLYAVVGQVKLMEIYSQLFAEHGLHVAQMLATRQDFENRTHSLNTKNCIESLFRERIVPIMNENDFVCIEELMFTDNDELAGMISRMIFADLMIILSNVEGVYDLDGQVVRAFDCDAEVPPHIQTSSKSAFGKGGMQSKFKMAQSVAASGIHVYIASSKEENALLKAVNGEQVGTRFIAKKS